MRTDRSSSPALKADHNLPAGNQNVGHLTFA